MSNSTESDLKELQIIFPNHSNSELTKFYLASNQNLNRTTLALLNGLDSITTSSTTTTTKGKKNKRKLLDNWLIGSSSSVKSKVESTQIPIQSTSTLPPIKSAFSVLRAPEPSLTSSSTLAPLPPLILGTPELIRQHTKGLCLLIPNVLSKGLASKLFLRMVQDSLGKEEEVTEDGDVDGTKTKKRIGGWEKNRWYLFDRQVESPHTTAFYVEAEGREGTSAYDQRAFAEAARYWYNGEERSASTFNSEMDEARTVIGPLVRHHLSSRLKNSLEYSGDWIPNVAAANCYKGSKESVGWHSDVLSYLGPFPTIASLSLGVARPFRLKSSSASSGVRTLEIPLPHNSLLIMMPGVQERFKHCVPEVKAVDTFKIWSGLEGVEARVKEQSFIERINITFRFYRPDFAPLPSSSSFSASTSSSIPLVAPINYKGTPMCACKIPTQLRPDARGKVKAFQNQKQLKKSSAGAVNEGEEEQEDELLFFWTCNGGAQNKGKGCGYFELLDMEKEGRGAYWKGSR